MGIKLVTHDDGAEVEAAKSLAQKIKEGWPWIESSIDSDICIISNVQCHGQSPKDLDIVILGSCLDERAKFRTNTSLCDRDGRKISQHHIAVESFCVVVEVKDHDSTGIKFQGTDLLVKYSRKRNSSYSSATLQNERQKYSLVNFLKKSFSSVPYVSNLIWLRNVDASDIPRLDHNILPSTITWNAFLNLVAKSNRPTNVNDDYILSCLKNANDYPIDELIKSLTVTLEPTSLDRKRMDRICLSLPKNHWSNEIGKKQIILRGRGGAGKTLMMLQAAWQAYVEDVRRTLVLTYNKALVADLRRIMTLAGIPNDLSLGGVHVQTVHSFFRNALINLGLLSKESDGADFFEFYDAATKTACQYFENGVLTQNDVEQLIRIDPQRFDWDEVMIDEAQDWPESERDLIRNLYHSENILVADGVDQLVRNSIPCDWKSALTNSQLHLLPLKTCLRMKRNLAHFSNMFSKEIGLEGWHVDPLDEAKGGRVIVVEGSYFENSKLHKELINENRLAGNEPVDMLCLVPPSLAINSINSSNSEIHHKFQKLSQKIWDGTQVADRDDYPVSTQQLRVVQYESCRGLEGWMLIATRFDEFFELKTEECRNKSKHMVGDLEEDVAQSRIFASRWAMMATTRSIDSIVIEVSKDESYLKSVLLTLASSSCNDIIEWRNH